MISYFLSFDCQSREIQYMSSIFVVNATFLESSYNKPKNVKVIVFTQEL